MAPIPTKTSLPALVFDRLRAGIEAGEWKGRLPSERDLSAELGVSRPTLRLALEQLKSEGWLEVVNKRTRIRKRPQRASKDTMRTRKIVFLSPVELEEFPSMGLLLYGELCRRLAPLGATVQVAASGALGRSNVETYLDELSAETRADAWVLYRTTAQVQRYFQRAPAPVVVFGNAHDGIDLPALRIDYNSALRHCLGKLKRLGHDLRDVALILPDSQLAGHIEIERCFVEQVGVAGEGQIFRHREEGDNVALTLKRALGRSTPATALIVLRTSVATTMHGLLSHPLGLVLPRDLSLVCLEDAPFMKHLFPEISRYTVDGIRVAQFVFSTLNRQLSSGVRKGWNHRPPVPEFVEGATMGKPKKR